MKRFLLCLLLLLPLLTACSDGAEYQCTITIRCDTVLCHMDELSPEKTAIIPENGILLPPTEVLFREGESVFDVLQRSCREHRIHMEAEWTPIYQSAYVEGIGNLYEFDCGAGSGWTYSVNGQFPNVGASACVMQPGDCVEWLYTCDLGVDVGAK